MRIINWCAKYKAICFFCLFYKFIYAVITKYTAISLTAAAAALAAAGAGLVAYSARRTALETNTANEVNSDKRR